LLEINKVLFGNIKCEKQSTRARYCNIHVYTFILAAHVHWKGVLFVFVLFDE